MAVIYVMSKIKDTVLWQGKRKYPVVMSDSKDDSADTADSGKYSSTHS